MTLHAFRIKKAMICIIALLYSMERGCKISNDSVVTKSGLLLEAICRTAMRACGPGLRTEIDSFFDVVANVNKERNASIASK